MSKTECLFQSFEGVGSIYLTTSKALRPEELQKHDCKAFILIYGQTKGKGEKQTLEKLDHITIKTKDVENNLGHLFLKTFNFIGEAKKNTSIMVWSPENWEMGAVFIFAYLIMKFQHTLQYISKINERKIRNISISACYSEQLDKLYKKELPMEEPKKKDELEQTVIGQRILRIRKKYSELGMESHAITELKKAESAKITNPQKQEKKTHKTQSKNNEPKMAPALTKKASSTTQGSKKQQSEPINS